ncbi:sulfate adenylyltransferase [Candidatus Giovannonibacteria bacterium RIFCSPLOWO2_12_FULL_44_25]|uniref:Pyruvate kinase n=2 Tax=Candidatus Giovannoniibacteriota TaxID=1752738 RepID=A0A1F5WAJ6_9BACT|nr:MAG: sulfate adenylyltransferase [Candidatus Giovannonibacteria bacterium GWA2_45_15]OGF59608.1 MAG: sulfate adenylyltransferase [Candidatus Giovannonibacteria bacterium RIFCSPHIGHO2_01_45_12]OGF60349.1 MAG: sulfate adenylyltransferase [Candidatus Giovannonibacteria bacterium RIFCSPHIGHO2_01_FULL_44_100]OGF72669.1 MAG: sulfate adenylyltransferase [Candidatus Giovannonibacteria bacterium RIFCSPHIGHO2_02_FULL_45_40]OGF83786.1 MAG: sulfate adenylyltransferase [Candidatus Giovannonibacteria bact
MKVKTIVTLGPATRTEESLRKIKDRGVDFVRVNMSHSGIEDLEYFVGLAKKNGLEFIIDTEGSQIRNGNLKGGTIYFDENDEVRLGGDGGDAPPGDKEKIFLRPKEIISQLEEGDILYMDFDALALRVKDTSTISKGYITADVISPGFLGSNKAVAVSSALGRFYNLPPLSPKDYKSIELGLKENVGYIAASFMRSGEFVDEVRRTTKGRMKIISKIECQDGLDNLDDIISKSDFLFIDRGDLSKEVPLEEIPFLQRDIIKKAKKSGKGVFVATNLLETMVEKKQPTRAEVHDVVNSVWGGAYGLVLAAETAIGKYPIECINMLNALISRACSEGGGGALIAPHGGKLISRAVGKTPDGVYVNSLKKLKITENAAMDAEQIAIGVFSPLEGFMGKKDLRGVLDNMRLESGVPWPLPVVLDVSEEEANKVREGDDIALIDSSGGALAILHLEEKFSLDKSEFISKMYGTNSPDHPGVQMVMDMKPVLLGGKITLLKRRPAENSAYALTPRQVRKIFAERHWSRVVGFHTRNVIHRSHEYIQLAAMEREHCDGLFVHPVVGKKKPGDYNASYIIKSYERMMNGIYPKHKVVFATFNTYSRYAGPREALFTAICRKNFGCSHFIVGRDHTGVGKFYHPNASHDIFDKFPDIGIKAVKFDEVFYSKSLDKHIHAKESPNHDQADKLSISGTEARKTFEKGELPPTWFMRPEIAGIITTAIKNGEKVFVEK